METKTNAWQFDVQLGVGNASQAGSWRHYRLTPGEASPLTSLGIDETTAEALTVDGARPRASQLDDGLLVVLRGVNLSPGADPEDMVSVRVWLTSDRILTVSPRRVFAVEDLHDSLLHGTGPTSPGAVLAALASTLIERMVPTIDKLTDDIEDMQDTLLGGQGENLQRPLAELRRSIAMLQRHLTPQREAISRLARDHANLLGDDEQASLRESADRMMRYVEDLASVRERSHVLQDELNNTISMSLNRNMYVMSVVAAIFLPLSLITGILGINVGGVPGADTNNAFWLVVGGLVIAALLEVWLLRRRRIL